MGARILVVEDDKDISRNLRKLLESEGYSVDSAENGQVALDILAKAPDLPRLILLDMMMPVMDGAQFRSIQRGEPKLAQIPVVLMSAHGQLDEAKAKLGLEIALRKPVDIEVILSVVSSFYPADED